MGLFGSIVKSLFGESISEKIARIARDHPFMMKLVIEDMTLDDGTQLEVLVLKARGIINTGLHEHETEQVLSSVQLLAGDSDSEMAPVICSIEDYQHKDTPFFHSRLPDMEANYGLVGGWEKWIKLATVPVASLTFARNGPQSVQAVFRFALTRSNKLYEKTADKEFNNDELGYLDGIEQRTRAKEVAVSLAVLVSGVDGHHDAGEAEIVKSFIRKQMAEIEDEDDRTEAKTTLNKAASSTHMIKDPSAIKTRGYVLAQEAADFKPSLKFMIMELLLDVAGADSVAEYTETEFLNSLAHEMGMDIDEYKNMRDKALPIGMYSEGSVGQGQGQIENMLGLNPNMSTAEKKSQLSKEYRKWNALKNSTDPEKSKQAKEMVRAIGELRKGL